MPPIARVHWSPLGSRSWSGEAGSLFALWPAPVDHDACFAQAGFRDFADSDEPWSEDFLALLYRLVNSLSPYGPATVSGGDASHGVLDGLLGGRKSLALEERLALAAWDDQFPACSARFGAPPRAVVCTSDGHPLVWAWLSEAVKGDWPAHLAAVAGDKALERTDLAWASLGPPSQFT